MMQTHAKQQTMPRATFWITAITLVLIWGTAYTLVSVGVRYLSPIWLVSLRCILAAGLVTIYARWRGHKFPPISDKRWVWYIGLGFTGLVAPFYCLSRGQLFVDSGLTAIIVGSMPLLTIVLAHFFAHEYLNLRKVIGFLFGFAGIVLLFLPEDFSLAVIKDWRSQCLILTAALLYAVTTVAAKRTPVTPPSLGAAMMLIAAAFMSTAAALTTGLPDITEPLIVWPTVIALGIASTALGNILYLYMVTEAGPSMVAKINYFPAVVSVIAGIIWLNEPFHIRSLAALCLIMLGLFIARKKP